MWSRRKLMLKLKLFTKYLKVLGQKKNSILKGTDAMEERSLRIYQEKTFFQRLVTQLLKY